MRTTPMPPHDATGARLPSCMRRLRHASWAQPTHRQIAWCNPACCIRLCYRAPQGCSHSILPAPHQLRRSVAAAGRKGAIEVQAVGVHLAAVCQAAVGRRVERCQAAEHFVCHCVNDMDRDSAQINGSNSAVW